MRFFILTLFIISLFSCQKEALETSFVHIDKFTFEYPSGANSSDIVDAWVYADDEFIGGFPIPCDIPIRKAGNVKLNVLPGVRELGPYSLELFKYVYPAIYYIYNPYLTEVNLKYGETTTIYPVTKYKDKSTLVFLEDFEKNSHILNDDEDKNAQTSVVFSTEYFKNGNKGGIIKLDTTNNVCTVATDLFYSVPTDNTPTYIELDYLGNSIQVGLIGVDDKTGQKSTVIDFVLPPKTEWTKSYINITQLLNSSQLSKYQVVLSTSMPLNENGKFASLNSFVAIDNLKLVHLN